MLGLAYLFSEAPSTTKSPCRSPVKSFFAIADSFPLSICTIIR
nr:MAG TPA: hypothetical protein [Bacteriophage sp.]